MWSPIKVLLALMFVAGLALLVFAFSQARQESLQQAPLLDVYFAHQDHKKVGCANCHHNYVDGTGRQFGCYQCHKEDTAVSTLMETQFHGLCRDCHHQLKQAGEKSGPVRQCSACHKPDTKP